MKEVWQKVVELYRYWQAGRRAIKQAKKIIAGPTYIEMIRELKSLTQQYKIAPNQILEIKIQILHAKLISIDRQMARRSFPTNGKYNPPKK